MIRKRFNEFDEVLDRLDRLPVLVGVAKIEVGRQDDRRGFGDGAELQEVDEVKVLQPVRALAVGQLRIESSEEFVEVWAEAFGGGLCEAVEGLVKAGEGCGRVPAVFLHLGCGVQRGQVDGDAEEKNIQIINIIRFMFNSMS